MFTSSLNYNKHLVKLQTKKALLVSMTFLNCLNILEKQKPQC